jgi:hypothetical protein
MHHANLLIGKQNWAFAQIPESERTQGTDVLVTHYERMSIADVRTLIHEAGLRPVTRPYRTFILICDSLLHEAQNALLKLFEEPNAHTIFYLILLREDILLPTLRSRLHLLGIENDGATQKSFDAFMNLGYADRLKCIEEKLSAEDVSWLSEFLHGFEVYAEKNRNAELIKEALLLTSYVYTTGASKKMLLEHVALTLPTS